MGSTDGFAGRPVVGRRMSAVDYVLRDLRDAIESGVIHVGERLPSEAALAARYSVCRTVPAAALAALRRTDDQLGTIQQLIERMDQERDEAVWTRLDASFHVAIARASGNPVFADVVSSIAAALSGQSEMLNRRPNRRAESQTEHRTIAAAPARGSAVEAEDAMRYPLEQVLEALSVTLTEPQRSSPPRRAAPGRTGGRHPPDGAT